jgi:Zn-finger nucleic acid-binding protein
LFSYERSELENKKCPCGATLFDLSNKKCPCGATLFSYERSELENKKCPCGATLFDLSNKKCPCGATLFSYERSELENKKCPCGATLSRKPLRERIGHKSSLRSARDPASLSRDATYSGFRFSTKAKQLAFSTRAIKHKKYILKVCIFLHFVRVERIELSSHPWQGRILPLNYTRIHFLYYPKTLERV